MNYIISANTDIGLTKDTNQDSVCTMVMNTPLGRMAFAIVCDGMGGLEKGEVASASLIRAFRNWVIHELPKLCGAPLEDAVIRSQWEQIITVENEKIKAYGGRQGVRMGTTVVAVLLTQTRYYILNVGDSRAYVLNTGIHLLTNDQTFVAREVAMGRMTQQEADQDSRRSVLLQCVGASERVYPEMFFGETEPNAVYLLCSDGFRHEITPEEIFGSLRPEQLYDEHSMQKNAAKLIDLNKQRQERDNISAVLIRTF